MLLAGCPGPTPAADAPPTGATATAETSAPGAPDATTTTDEPRARSEPPPGPPLPEGVRAFRRDVVTLSLSGDGRYLVGGDLAGKALLWDLERGVFVWGDETPEGNRIRPVVFPTRGARWIAGAFDTPDVTWRLYDATRAELVVAWGEPGATAVDAGFDREARRVAVASSKPERVEVYALDDGQAAPRRVWHRDAKARAVALDASGERVAWTDGPRVEVRAVLDDASVMSVSEDAPTSRLLFDGDVLVGAQGATIVRWSMTGAPRSVTRLSDERRTVRQLERLPRGLVAVTRAEEEGIVVWDADTGAPVAEVSFGCTCEVHALAASGCMAACGCSTPHAEVRWTRVRDAAFPGCP